MLVLSRKRGDAVAMGEPTRGDHVLKVTVLEIRSSQVKLGFEAADHIAVHRWEVWERIRNQNEELGASGANLADETPSAGTGGTADRW